MNQEILHQHLLMTLLGNEPNSLSDARGDDNQPIFLIVDGKTVLHLAIQNNNSTLLESLLNSNNIQLILNLPDNNGTTPLMMAISQSNHELVLKLLDLGANLHIKEKKGKTAFIKAIEVGHLKMVESLLAEKTIQNSPWILSDALHCAVRERQREIVTLLLKKYNAPNFPDSEGHTALHWGQYSMDADIVTTLTNHFGSDEAQRKNDPELALYLDRCKAIKDCGQIFNLKIKTKVKLPNNKNYTHVSSEGQLTLQSISLLVYELEKYIQMCTLTEQTRQNFQKIHAGFLNEEKYLKVDGSLTANDLGVSIEHHNLVPITAGCLSHDLTETIYKNWMILSDYGSGMGNSGPKVYRLTKKVTPDYIEKVKTTKANDDQWKILPIISEVIDSNHPLTIMPKKSMKHGSCSFVNAKASVEAMLYILKYEEFYNALTSKNMEEIALMNAQGIYNSADAKRKALEYASKEYKTFIRKMRDRKIEALINDYKNPEILSEDRKIALALLGAILAHQYKYLRPKIHIYTDKQTHELKRSKQILHALSEEDRYEIIESLNNDDVDLLWSFIQYNDDELIQWVFTSSSLGRTLRNAAATNNLRVMQYLIQHQWIEKINEVDDHGNTALMLATQRGFVDMVLLLLKHGANPNVINKKTGHTALMIATARQDTAMKQALDAKAFNTASR